MSYDDILAVLFCPFAIAVVYIAGKYDLLEQVRERFINWVDELSESEQEENGLSEATKQTLLDSFMKGADK